MADLINKKGKKKLKWFAVFSVIRFLIALWIIFMLLPVTIKLFQFDLGTVDLDILKGMASSLVSVLRNLTLITVLFLINFISCLFSFFKPIKLRGKYEIPARNLALWISSKVNVVSFIVPIIVLIMFFVGIFTKAYFLAGLLKNYGVDLALPFFS